MTPKIHKFEDTGEAYDASQTHDEIRDGDILSVASEKVVGIVVEAWPIAVGENYGEFHEVSESGGFDWEAVPTTASDYTETKDYSASFKLAIEELDRICMEIADKKWKEQ